jgi:hypothetical protein
MGKMQRHFSIKADGRTEVVIIQIRKYNTETKQDDLQAAL